MSKYEGIEIDFNEIEVLSDFSSDLIFLNIPKYVKDKIKESECSVFGSHNIITDNNNIPSNSQVVAYDFKNSSDSGIITLNEITNGDRIVGFYKFNNFYEWAFKSEEFKFETGYSGTPIFKLTDSKIFIYGLFKQINMLKKKPAYYRAVHFASINRLFKAIYEKE